MNIPQGQIEWLVGNMHVGTPRRDVVKDFARRFRRARLEHGKRFDRAFRKACYRHALAAHEDNRSLVREFRL